MDGNVRAQRDILKAVRDYEQADAQAAAINEYVTFLAQNAESLAHAVLAAQQHAPTTEQKVDYVAAARQVWDLLGLDKLKAKKEAAKKEAAEREAANSETANSETANSETANSETCPPAQQTATEKESTERSVPRPFAASPAAPGESQRISRAAPQPESDAAPAAAPPPSADRSAEPPVRLWSSRPRADRDAPTGKAVDSAASPAAAPPADDPSLEPPVRLWSSRPRRDRNACPPAQEAVESPGADVPAGRLHNRLPPGRRSHHRAAHSSLPSGATGKGSRSAKAGRKNLQIPC
jgi:hypothetical protein